MKKILPVVMILLISGCDDRYRYPCQDPDNWTKEECKKPNCLVSGYCTENLISPAAVEEYKRTIK